MRSSTSPRFLGQRIGFEPSYLPTFERKLFIAGPDAVRRLTNFFVLLILATAIATFGLISNSTATVIGAMIVAPLMGPIMAMAAAVVMGSVRRALLSLALVVVGVVTVILVSIVLTWAVPDVSISFTENGELASRIAPGLLALFAALASGAAGGYITSREEIADSMGGVAIAISLVPPLCVVGIAFNRGEWGAAGGALLLFVTNFLAILLAGGIVFLLSGLGRLAVTGDRIRMRRNAFILIVVATLLVAIPLTVTTSHVIHAGFENRRANQIVENWIAGTTHTVVNVSIYDRFVNVTIDGYGETHPLPELANLLAAGLKRPVVVNLRTIPSQVQASTGAAP